MKYFVSILLSISLIAPAFSQTQNKPPQQEEKIVLGTTEVVLDVVVRDKKGRMIKELSAADFEIYEDGLRQNIESFRLSLREAVPAAKEKEVVAPRKEETAQPSRRGVAGINLVALVFDRLSPNARNLAHKAATQYAAERTGKDDFTGVFSIDLALKTIQSYTDNSQLVLEAIDRAASLATGTYASGTEQSRSLSSRSNNLGAQAEAAAQAAQQAGAARDSGGAGQATAELGGAAVEQMLTEMNVRMLENFESLERDQQGYATTNGLLAVVDSLRSLPGRKTIMFFSEGLSIPPAIQARFRSVISAANRANVSIYSVDAAGLRVDSTDAEARREINALADSRMRQVSRGRDDASGPLTKSLERNEDLLRLNPHSGLGDLADQTGGTLISNTNDLSNGLKRADEDMRAHYVLSYIPKNTDYDGKFRQISVKVNRSGLDVQSRKGYFAINTPISVPVLDYEAPALAAMSRPSTAIPLRVTGLSFPESNRTGLAPMLVEVPANVMTFSSDAENKYKTDFSVVVLVRDQHQQIVKKLSQHYQLTGPMDKVEAAKRSEILFYRETSLPPGKYSVEAIAYDAPTGKSGMKTSSVEVPGGGETQLRLSSVILLKRAERLAQSDQKSANPFHFGEVLIYPSLGEPVRKSAVKQLAFFFTAYIAKGSADKHTMTLEVVRGGKAIGQMSSELPAPDSSGRIQYASALPLDNFPPGAYELKVTVKDSRTAAARSTLFTVEP
jgi:VWFA-related protein